LAPGHVSTVIGAGAYREISEKFKVPIVVAGFEPLDILYAISLVLRQLREGRAEVENAYPRAVTEEGNLRAKELFREVFRVGPAIWRGIGEIPDSGFYLCEEFVKYDAKREFGVEGEMGEEKPPGCLCAEVLMAKAFPTDCPLYGEVCTPMTPVGPCMVGSEGACNIWYRYSGRPRL
jgi:Hydrogenase maturation factor